MMERKKISGGGGQTGAGARGIGEEGSGAHGSPGSLFIAALFFFLSESLERAKLQVVCAF